MTERNRFITVAAFRDDRRGEAASGQSEARAYTVLRVCHGALTLVYVDTIPR